MNSTRSAVLVQQSCWKSGPTGLNLPEQSSTPDQSPELWTAGLPLCGCCLATSPGPLLFSSLEVNRLWLSLCLFMAGSREMCVLCRVLCPLTPAHLRWPILILERVGGTSIFKECKAEVHNLWLYITITLQLKKNPQQPSQ